MSGVLGGLIAAFPTPVTSSFESIATATGTGSSNTITFSSIPGTYKSLQLRCNVLTTTDADAGLRIRINGDTGSNYSYHYLQKSGGGAVTAAGAASQSTIVVGGSDLLSTYPCVSLIDIVDYASTSKNKTLRMTTGMSSNGTFNDTLAISSGAWFNTSAITSITIYTNGASDYFSTSAKFALYGVK
jgi:hypothetical protein